MKNLIFVFTLLLGLSVNQTQAQNADANVTWSKVLDASAGNVWTVLRKMDDIDKYSSGISRVVWTGKKGKGGERVCYPPKGQEGYFKEKIVAAGFDVKEGDSPIVPIMLYDAALSQKFADGLLKEGVYAIGFFYPVVPKGKARIRTQISAAHTKEHLDKAIAAFIKVGKDLGVI